MKLEIFALALCGATLAAQTSSQTINGVLMDATCPAIASSQSSMTENAMPRNTVAGPSHASATGTTGAATETAVTTRPAEKTAKKAAADEANEVTHAGRQTSTSGLNNQPGVGSTSGATAASAVGTTGSSPTPGAGTTPGTGPVAEDSTGQRSRAGDATRYADCGVKPTTSSFAIYANDGTLYRLDDAGSAMVRKQAGPQGFEGKTEVTAVGSARGDRLTVTSVQRNRASHP